MQDFVAELGEQARIREDMLTKSQEAVVARQNDVHNVEV